MRFAPASQSVAMRLEPLKGVSVLSLAMHLVLNIVYNVALHLTPNVVGPNAALNLDHSLSPVPWPYTVNLRFRPMKSRP
ncbi:uncharacterized protein PG998_002026 [Apiospora kogelbergensis]|uniref:uncharacterized protein n=1 Tax=Apiospora kogelbergensis TaxID=1337665 RepID=UPI003131E6A9